MALKIEKDGGKAAGETDAENPLSASARTERIERIAVAQGNVSASNVPGVKQEPNWDPHRQAGLIADRNLYLGKDGRGVYDTAGEGAGKTLLAAKGGNIAPDVVARHGLELKGDRVEQKKGEDGAPAAPDAGTPNEGQLDDGTPLVKVQRTGVLRPEPAPENPLTAIEEELKGKNPEPGSAEAKAAAAKKESEKVPARKTPSARKSSARKAKG